MLTSDYSSIPFKFMLAVISATALVEAFHRSLQCRIKSGRCTVEDLLQRLHG